MAGPVTGAKRAAVTVVVAVATALAAASAAWAGAPALDLETTPATELADRMAGGELTSVELTRAYLDRIAAVNQRGPALNAVRSLNPRALREARTCPP